MQHNVTICIGVQYGDEGKGKYVNAVAQEFDVVIKGNGGPNAGHTSYAYPLGMTSEGRKKFVTHQIPTGAIYGKISIIGPDCVVDPRKLMEEAKQFTHVNLQEILYVSENAHIITEDDVAEDNANDVVGTTGCGVGQCYRNKHGRTGIRVKDMIDANGLFFGFKVVNIRDFFRNSSKPLNVLIEGCQADNLDINWGNYPFVTSSHCTTNSLLGGYLPIQSVKKIVGCAKVYETYVGKMDFGDTENDKALLELGELGHERGSTTGRVRKCNWINLQRLIASCYANGIDTLLINKCDILKEFYEKHPGLPIYFYDENGNKCNIENDTKCHNMAFKQLQEIVEDTLKKYCPYLKTILWSSSPFEI